MINVVIVLKRDFSHVLYLHYSFLAYDSIKTIMSMIIIELIITTILIMITIVIYWNVIGVLAVYFHKSFCTVVIGQIHLGQISPVETMSGEKKSPLWKLPIFFLGWVVVTMVIVINSVSVPRVFVLLKKILCHQFLRSFKV